jgi:hypothetical protein
MSLQGRHDWKRKMIQNCNFTSCFLVVQNLVLRKIFVPKREEGPGRLRKLHNEELHSLYFSPNICRVIKSRRMKMDRTCIT